MTPGFAQALAALRAMAMAYPEAFEEQPWGELVAKVRKKMFVMYSASDTSLSVTLKLPHSAREALEHDFATPTGYGLGKHGWVSCSFSSMETVDLPTLYGWMEESYRTVAPKRLSKQVPLGGPLPGERPVMAEVPEGAPIVVVVTDDPLRAERCVAGLAGIGLRGEVAATSDLDALGEAAPDCLVVDLGRSQAKAFDVAGQLSMIHFDCPLVLAGIRDARAEAQVHETLPGAAASFRQPPGDPTVLKGVSGLLRR